MDHEPWEYLEFLIGDMVPIGKLYCIARIRDILRLDECITARSPKGTLIWWKCLMDKLSRRSYLGFVHSHFIECIDFPGKSDLETLRYTNGYVMGVLTLDNDENKLILKFYNIRKEHIQINNQRYIEIQL